MRVLFLVNNREVLNGVGPFFCILSRSDGGSEILETWVRKS